MEPTRCSLTSYHSTSIVAVIHKPATADGLAAPDPTDAVIAHCCREDATSIGQIIPAVDVENHGAITGAGKRAPTVGRHVHRPISRRPGDLNRVES